jgi:hypothetical protein
MTSIKKCLAGAFLMASGVAGIAYMSLNLTNDHPLADVCAEHQRKNDRICTPEEWRQFNASKSFNLPKVRNWGIMGLGTATMFAGLCLMTGKKDNHPPARPTP